jgi:hypothetical protein
VYLLSNDNVDALNCKICNDYLGWILDDNNDYRPTLNFTEFYQIDEDGEHLLCVPCYEEVTKEDIDEE